MIVQCIKAKVGRKVAWSHYIVKHQSHVNGTLHHPETLSVLTFDPLHELWGFFLSTVNGKLINMELSASDLVQRGIHSSQLEEVLNSGT